MTHAIRLNARVATAALVTFSASCFLSSPEAQAQSLKRPEYAGSPEEPGVVGSLVSALQRGAVVIVLDPDDGSIIAHVLKRAGPNSGIKVYQMNENDNIWYNEAGKPEDPPFPPNTGNDLKGAGIITDIRIYQGSDCVQTNLNGKWVTVCTSD